MPPSPRWFHSSTRTRRLLHCAAFAATALWWIAGYSLLLATITPIKPSAANGATNTRVDTRNPIAKALVGTEKIPTDDQRALMSGHQDLYQDTVQQALQSPAS